MPWPRTTAPESFFFPFLIPILYPSNYTLLPHPTALHTISPPPFSTPHTSFLTGVDSLLHPPPTPPILQFSSLSPCTATESDSTVFSCTFNLVLNYSFVLSWWAYLSNDLSIDFLLWRTIGQDLWFYWNLREVKNEEVRFFSKTCAWCCDDRNKRADVLRYWCILSWLRVFCGDD